MPDLNLKVTPVFGESQYSYALIHDILESRIRDEIKVIRDEFFRISRQSFFLASFGSTCYG